MAVLIAVLWTSHFLGTLKKEVHTWIAKAYNDYEDPKTVILKS
jgi:hypothetical protein